MEVNDGGPAFPTADANRAEDYGTYGLTMRDYFAAKAMQTLIDHTTHPEMTASDAYEYADAMIKARQS